MKLDDAAAKKPLRRGTPFTVYFDAPQTEALNSLARERHVSKATIIRLAVDHLLRQIEGGQLPLPLGIREQEASPEPLASGAASRVSGHLLRDS